MRLIWVFLVASLSACSSFSGGQLSAYQTDSPTSFIGPDGGPAYLMPCNAIECYKKARELCPGGYTVFDSKDDSNNGSSHHYIAYECKK